MTQVFINRPIRSFFLLTALLLFASGGLAPANAAQPAILIPPPDLDLSSEASSETAVLAGGCFWGVQAVFQHVTGVTEAVSGYSGGTAKDATYKLVSRGATDHAEAVEISFDPRRISYGEILRIYFSVAHDPTELNRQGPDHGRHYRSEIFTTNDRQQKIANAYIAQLDRAKIYDAPIVTKVSKLTRFYKAEAYHQDYATRHPDQPYIVRHDLPKIAALKEHFPNSYRKIPVLVGKVD